MSITKYTLLIGHKTNRLIFVKEQIVSIQIYYEVIIIILKYLQSQLVSFDTTNNNEYPL